MGQGVRVQHVGWFVLLAVLTAWVVVSLLGLV